MYKGHRRVLEVEREVSYGSGHVGCQHPNFVQMFQSQRNQSKHPITVQNTPFQDETLIPLKSTIGTLSVYILEPHSSHK